MSLWICSYRFSMLVWTPLDSKTWQILIQKATTARPKAAEANTVPGALLGIWDAGKRKRKRACAFDALIALAQARTRSVA